MGAESPAASQAFDQVRAGARKGYVLASNSGVCVEERYPVALNLGSGKVHWDGWVNVDLYSDTADFKCDLRQLDFSNNHADAIAAIHVLEHFYHWEVEPLLTEWKRVLKPGGKLILELPCMDKVLGYALRCLQQKEAMQPFMTLHAMYGDPRHEDPAMCHKWGWFQKELLKVLESLHFREITVCEPRYHFPFRDMRIECIK